MERGYNLVVFFHSKNHGNHVNHPGNPGLVSVSDKYTRSTGSGRAAFRVDNFRIATQLVDKYKIASCCKNQRHLSKARLPALTSDL